MSYGIVYFKGTNKTKQYCTNTNYINSWSNDIERAALMVQKSSAERAVKKMYTSGFKEQLYVVLVEKMPVQFSEIPMPSAKTGYVIIFSNEPPDRYYYTGPKKSRSYSYHLRGVLESATTFKTEKAAQETLEAYLKDHKEFAEDNTQHYTYTKTYHSEKEHMKVIKL